jgi:hypothetical protein
MTDFSGHFSDWLRSPSILKQFQIFLNILGHIHGRYLHEYLQIFLRGIPPLIRELLYW